MVGAYKLKRSLTTVNSVQGTDLAVHALQHVARYETKVCVAGGHHSAPLRSIVELESRAVEAPIEAGFELE